MKHKGKNITGAQSRHGVTNLRNKRIGVLMGGFGSEREVSLKSGSAVIDSLRASGYKTVAIDVGDDLIEWLREERVEAAFIALHGPVGEDGIVQGVLEFLRIPYTGSGVLGSAFAMDKRMAKRAFEAQGIPTAKWESLHRNATKTPLSIKPPLVVKPSRQGSTVGISIINTDDHDKIEDALNLAFSLDEWVLVEEFIPGAEITVGVLDGEALGCVEIRPEGGFYDYERKYTPGKTQYLAPAPIPESVASRVRAFAVTAYNALGCRGAARVDFRVTPEGEPRILEVNTIPGLTSTSLLPKSAGVVGMDFNKLVERMLAGAKYERP